MRPRLFPLLFVCLLAAVPALSQRVIEGESSFAVVGQEGVVRLMVEHTTPSTADAELTLVDNGDTVKATAVRSNLALAAGKQVHEFRMKLGDIAQHSNDALAWYRLKYTVGSATGTISLSQIMPDLFEMRIIAGGDIVAGMTYRARVRALNPFTEKPAAGVKVSSTLRLELKGDEDRELKLNATGETDRDGFAMLDFKIPVETEFDDNGDITVTGVRNGLTREAKDDLRALTEDVQILSMTDKPIYQPGQMLNVRGLLMKGVEGFVVLPGREIEFRVEDEDDTLLYREKVTSSAYGIAAISWRIPANAKLGQLNVTIRDSEEDTIGHHRVKLSRYDLPNFVVNVKPQKPYYLPIDKQAEVEIRADYLFGKPVTKGKVRVVEENEREWNYKEQKYDIDEGQVQEGVTNAAGKFIAKFDLADAHEDIADSDYQRFKDIKFAAYFTDPTTNKTEQRRFDLRVTREPIHVYLIKGPDFDNPNLPLEGFVSTFYADGTPAECDVEIRASEDEDKGFRTYLRLRTNSYGAGQFTMPRPKIGDPDDELFFRVVARDKSLRIGTANEDEEFYNHDDEAIRVHTDKSIYKPGEPVKVSITSTLKTGTVYIDVTREFSVIESRFATLKNGKAELTIPHEESFKGPLKVAAFVEDPEDGDELISNARGIIYPSKQGISVDATFDKAVYKPNEEATVKFGVLDVVGRAVESALGIVVFDKAVEERARTDADFGGMFSNMSRWLGYGNGFGSVNIKNINELDLSKPISTEMQLVAAVIMSDGYYRPGVFRSERYFEEAKSVFSGMVSRQFGNLSFALSDSYSRLNGLHPTDDASLARILESHGIDLARLPDPWGMQYKAEFGIANNQDTIRITTAGPDKMFGTGDDFAAYTNSFDYFAPMGKAVDMAARNHNARTGEFIRDPKTLAGELRVGTLLDRWGSPYRVSTDGDNRLINIRLISSGPDRKAETYNPQYQYHAGDDFTIWTTTLDLFAATERRITEIQKSLKAAPTTEAQFRNTLIAKGVDLSKFRDGFGNPVYVTVKQGSRYWDKVTFETVQAYGDPRKIERRVVTPVTQQIVTITVHGRGRDGKENTYDDPTFTQYVHVLSEQSKDEPKPVPVMQPIAYSTNTGVISGTVTDPTGNVVPGVTVTATSVTSVTRSVTTNDDGRYIIGALVPGAYNLRFAANGFKDSVIENVQVKAGSTTPLNITLDVGAVSEVVTVAAGASTVETSSASVATVVDSQQIQALPLQGRNAMALVALQPGVAAKKRTDDTTQTDQQTETPRLREYFPETLLWNPEVITGADGTAEVKFRMADNITTWKMYTIASTKDGKIGYSEKEATAFQSFFVDLDPPKFLTTGDEIFLPTQVRNYTDKRQNVNVTMANADWFEFLGCSGTRTSSSAARQTTALRSVPPAVAGGLMQPISLRTNTEPTACDSSGMKLTTAVDSGQSENTIFGFKAVKATKEGKQRVTAIAQGDSDAIERPVTVRPDGHEVVHTESRYFTGTGQFAVNFPANALPATHTAELKIYPNLMAHVAESVEGLLRRPYGCGEQTISSTYPNVMILKFAGGDDKPRRISESIEKKARKYLQSGYERLIGYQVADGGFSYWGGKDSSDFALTAYALRFLADAREFIEVDREVIKKANDYLLREQRPDGSWGKMYRWETAEDAKRTKSVTTYIARTLAMQKPAREQGLNAQAGTSTDPLKGSLTRALTYLRSRNAEIDDPYSLALFGLAAHDSGDTATANEIKNKLRTLAKDESGAAYWNLESNTAFNGWGYTGRIETTALVTQLLLKLDPKDELIGNAMIFLLKNKDRYGVWYSTQTTINVLDTFVASMAESGGTGTQTVDVMVNGTKHQTVEIGPDKLDQIVIDLGARVANGPNSVELRSSDRSPLMAQVVANHYIDWSDADSSGRQVNQSRALRLDYKCDRTSAAIMNEITCSVEAERIGYRGYGMLLAEIGTPPGADVSRESLQAAMDADWSISRYDILSDRIVLYMWSKAGGTKFNFKFKPRYAINAKTPASTVYDYYNPEANAVVAPLSFAVK